MVYVQSPTGDKWYRFDDSFVSEATAQDVRERGYGSDETDTYGKMSGPVLS